MVVLCPAKKCVPGKATAQKNYEYFGLTEEKQEVHHIMAMVSMKQLLEAGVHFGHQTRRWNPKMAKYIFTQA